MFDRVGRAAAETSATARAIELAEQLVEHVTGARRDWQAVAEAASELACLAAGLARTRSTLRERP
jgi:hypothetical protein